MQKCLIIGANGFVGSYITDALQNTSVDIIAFDHFSRDPQFSAPNVKLVAGDFFDDTKMREALFGMTYVMHTFSATTPFVSDNDPYKDITDNLQRSVRIFELCVEAGIKKIGFISSAGTVYGSVSEHKTAEETDTPLPVSPYGINKLSIEHYLEYFKRKYGIDYTVYRLTNPYGPRQITKNNQGVIPAFIDKVKNNHELTIYGDGHSSRDYVYMQDAANMIAESFIQHSDYAIYNIGSGVQTSLNDIIAALKVVSNKEPRLRFETVPKTFLEHSSVSIARFVKEFGLPQLTSLEEGLTKTFNS